MSLWGKLRSALGGSEQSAEAAKPPTPHELFAAEVVRMAKPTARRALGCAIVLVAVAACGAGGEATQANTAASAPVRCSQGVLDACDPATKAAYASRQQQIQAAQEQAARQMRCAQGDLDSCDDATRSARQKQLAQMQANQAATAAALQQRRCDMGEVDACDPATRAQKEQQAKCEQGQLDACDPIRRAVKEQELAQKAQEARQQTLEWQLCNFVAQRQQAQNEIQTEKQNPSGVVDLKVLHDAGSVIQQADQAIVTLKARFLQERGRAFVARDCDGNYP